MRQEVLAYVVGIFVTFFVLAIYWLGGGEFERGIPLAYFTVVGVVLGGLTVVTIGRQP